MPYGSFRTRDAGLLAAKGCGIVGAMALILMVALGILLGKAF